MGFFWFYSNTGDEEKTKERWVLHIIGGGVVLQLVAAPRFFW
jgi:hypothetical protein